MNLQHFFVVLVIMAMSFSCIESSPEFFHVNSTLSPATSTSSSTASSSALTRFLQALERYEIGYSELNFRGTLVTLRYPLSDLVPDGTVGIKIYSDSDCSVDITVNDFLVPEVIYDENPTPDGSKNREVTIEFTVDPIKIQETDVWLQDVTDQFFMNFCVGVGLYAGDASEAGAAPVKEQETVIKLQVDLMGDFGIEFDVQPYDPNAFEAYQEYKVEGYLCDENFDELTVAEPTKQGGIVRICVRPTAIALVDGVYMRSVNFFTFQRTDLPNGEVITQKAVLDGETANPGVTELFCQRGTDMCYFDTLLKADFYFAPGYVSGYGEAWLQFGTGETRRVLIEVDQLGGQRQLQEGGRIDGGFSNSAYFDVTFMTLPGEDFAYSAIAYECDSHYHRVDPRIPKDRGVGIRVCISPDEISLNLGMAVHSVESWNFTRSDISVPATQAAVEPGEFLSSDGLSLLMCPPGSPICAFRTQFIDEFYESYGTILGVGSVVLQYASNDDQMAFGRRRNLQQEFLSFNIAGTAPVSLDTEVTNQYPDGDPCEFEHLVSEWWIEEPINKRYMYIGLAVGTLLAIIASLCWCWMFPCLGPRRDDEEEEENEGLNVNVDIEKKEEVTTTESSNNVTRQESKRRSKHHDTSDDDSDDATSPSSGRQLDVPAGSDDVVPSRSDVIFDDIDHPGTKRLIKICKSFIKNKPDTDFSDDVYKAIKSKMDSDIQYFEVSLSTSSNRVACFVPIESRSEVKAWYRRIYRRVERGRLGGDDGEGRSSSNRSLKLAASDRSVGSKRSVKSSGSNRSLKSSSSSKRSSSSKTKRSGSSRRLLCDDDDDVSSSRKIRKSRSNPDLRRHCDDTASSSSSRRKKDKDDDRSSGRKEKGHRKSRSDPDLLRLCDDPSSSSSSRRRKDNKDDDRSSGRREKGMRKSRSNPDVSRDERSSASRRSKTTSRSSSRRKRSSSSRSLR